MGQEQFTGSKRHEVLASPELKQSYGFLTAPGKTPGSTALGDIAGGTVIALNPEDGRGAKNGREAYDRMVDAAVPKQHPYHEGLKDIQPGDPLAGAMVRQAMMPEPERQGPYASYVPRLQSPQDNVSVLALQPLDSYRQTPGGLYGMTSGVGDKYPAVRQSSDEEHVALAAIHELQHNKDKIEAHSHIVPSDQILKTEIAADCAAYDIGRDEKTARALGLGSAAVQEYADARAIGSILDGRAGAVSHSTAIADQGGGVCKRDFSEASATQAAHELTVLNAKIDGKIGRAYANEAMATLLALDTNNLKKGTPQEQALKEHLYDKVKDPVTGKIDEAKTKVLMDGLGKSDAEVVGSLGQSMRGSDPALVYGAVKGINETKGPDGKSGLTETQQHYVDRFTESADRRYPTMKESPLVEVARDPKAVDPALQKSMAESYKMAREERLATEPVAVAAVAPDPIDSEPAERRVELQGLGR